MAASMHERREYAGGVRLQDGRILAVSGHPLLGTGAIASAEIYDAETGQWSETGSLRRSRNSGNGATRLHDGRVLLAGGISAACIDNVVGVETLLDLSAPIAGDGTWSPLEEALYWGHSATVELLLRRGVPVDNLRKYSALGDLEGVKRCFDAHGQLNQEAGEVAWPFGPTIPEEVRRDHRQIVNNALVFAAAWGQQAAAAELLKRGAEINAIPAGFDFAGTPLHYAALNNRREMADWLLNCGANPTLRDTKVENTPDGWADYAQHRELARHLRSIRGQRDA